jgi:hypothetical protein
MRVRFSSNMDNPRNAATKAFLIRGIEAAGDKVVGPQESADLQIVSGVSGRSIKDLESGDVMLLDKGYMGRAYYLRVAFGGLHSWHVLKSSAKNSKRLEAVGVSLSRTLLDPEPTSTRPVLMVAGTSQKFCDFAGLGDCTEAHTRLVSLVLSRWKHRKEPIIRYRPKKTWTGAKPIPGVQYDRRDTIDESLRDCWGVVTLASNAALDAWRLGLPAAVLGPGVLRDFADKEFPRSPVAAATRHRVFCALSYMQWLPREFGQKATWITLRSQHDRSF